MTDNKQKKDQLTTSKFNKGGGEDLTTPFEYAEHGMSSGNRSDKEKRKTNGGDANVEN